MPLQDAPAASADQDILDVIEQKKEANMRDGRRNGIHTAIGIGIYALASIVFPPVGLGGMVAFAGMLYGSYYGWDLVKNLGAGNSLERAKKEAQEDPTFAKTADRADATRKRNGIWGNIALAALGVFAVGLLSVAFAPASAVAAVAAPLLMPALGVGLVTAFGQELTKGSYRAAEAIAQIGKRLVLGQKTAALEAEAAKLKGPAPVVNAPSPTASFDKAANGNTPPAPEAKDSAPVLKPDVPKLG